ncbi:hypothetical protein EXS72_02985 [Candidatus Pacearchaeota archaeon]|nr:hypothetical protein [Candidatus Pacearchaeota archaeon]
MYVQSPPKPLVIDLNDPKGFEYRQQAASFVSNTRVRGIESGNALEQSYGKLAEIVIRNFLGLPEATELSHDIPLPSGITLDVKCRSGVFPFQENYIGTGGIAREAKHNLFTRQVMDPRLDTDVYLMTHLQKPIKNNALPGTIRQKSWNLFVCGWVSKQRVLNEGVYLPRGSLTEQGNTWFVYRANNTEIYNTTLNGLRNLEEISNLDRNDVDVDSQKGRSLNLTSIDAIRIALDMNARGILSSEAVTKLKMKLNLENVPTFFHSNQYNHLGKWLKNQGIISSDEFEKIDQQMPEVPYEDN